VVHKNGDSSLHGLDVATHQFVVHVANIVGAIVVGGNNAPRALAKVRGVSTMSRPPQLRQLLEYVLQLFVAVAGALNGQRLAFDESTGHAIKEVARLGHVEAATPHPPE